MHVVLVHQCQVVENVFLSFEHRLHALFDNHRDFVCKTRVISPTARNRRSDEMTGTVLMLQALTRESRASCCGTQQKASCARIGRGHDEITNALESKD